VAENIVAYYSRTGTCKAVASELAARLHADLEEITPIDDFSGGSGALRGVVAALFGKRSPIHAGKQTGSYRRVILVAPIWAGRVASPAMTWLSRCQGERKDVELITLAGAPAAPAAATRMKTPDGFTVKHILHISSGELQAKGAAIVLSPLFV
jgi:hypothetical protein